MPTLTEMIWKCSTIDEIKQAIKDWIKSSVPQDETSRLLIILVDEP